MKEKLTDLNIIIMCTHYKLNVGLVVRAICYHSRNSVVNFTSASMVMYTC